MIRMRSPVALAMLLLASLLPRNAEAETVRIARQSGTSNLPLILMQDTWPTVASGAC